MSTAFESKVLFVANYQHVISNSIRGCIFENSLYYLNLHQSKLLTETGD